MARKLSKRQKLDNATDGQFGWCRTLAHSWEVEGKLQVHASGSELHYALKCDRCGCQRINVIALKGKDAGQYLGRYYRHPKGYLLHGMGDERPTRAQIRAHFFGRLLNGGSA